MKTAAQTAVLMMVVTFASKCFGFIREMVIAYYFGASYVTDAFVMAIAIPGIIFGGIIGAVSISYMPTFSKIIELEGEDKANEFTSGVIYILCVIAVTASLIGVLFSDEIVGLLASGFDARTAGLTSFFLRITITFLIFTAVADVLEAFLRYKGVFLPQVAFGLIQNAIVILVIVISAFTSYYYLPIGYILAYFIRVVIMGRISKKNNFHYSKKQKMSHTVKRVISLAVPVFVGNSMAQVNAFVDKTLASGLAEGSVSALNYGNLLVTMISGLTITIITTIIYPKLTQACAVSDYGRMNQIVETGITLIIVIAVPCTLGSMFYSNQIVEVIYERGAFDSLATMMTGSAFFYYVLGLTFASLSILLTQVYYSMDNMKTPMIFGGTSVIINIVLNLSLVNIMALSGLALATSIASICGTLLLFISLRKKYKQLTLVQSYAKLIKIIIAAAISVGASYVFMILTSSFTGIQFPVMIQLSIEISFVGILYLALLRLIKIEEINLIASIFKKRKF